MPKVTVRSDGTAFIRAKVHPGSDQVRAWEVTTAGVAWLRKRGVGVEEEMGRALFDRLRQLGFAYIANPSGKRPPTTHRRKMSRVSVEPSGVRVQRERGPNGVRRIITVPESLMPKSSTPRRKKRQGANATAGKAASPPATGTSEPVSSRDTLASQKPDSPTLPAHWRRRTKKKDWFSPDKG